jgi:hypothetical protein
LSNKLPFRPDLQLAGTQFQTTPSQWKVQLISPCFTERKKPSGLNNFESPLRSASGAGISYTLPPGKQQIVFKHLIRNSISTQA